MKGDREAVSALSPIAPPCFPTRTIWLEYVGECLVQQRRYNSVSGPFVLMAGHPVEFNAGWSFCGDCNVVYSLAMQRQGRCNPLHLADILE